MCFKIKKYALRSRKYLKKKEKKEIKTHDYTMYSPRAVSISDRK
jgi:hypothetical protein